MTFTHKQSAHCESGVMASMLSHNNLPMTEPMAFGLANALAYAYIPLVKLAGQPLISYRLPPKFIIKGLAKRLGLKFRFQTFRNPMAGMEALELAVNNGQLVGLQTSVFWLPYFPEEMRFHFNAHNMLVYGKEGRDYLVSDPVFEEPVKVAGVHLTKARFAKGALAPKGLMYTLESAPDSIDYEQAIPQAIAKNIKVMTGAPLPIIGIRGMRHVAKKIRKLGSTHEREQQNLFLGHMVRMQEEIGTGGAGFRFIYASFLEESANILGDNALKESSEALTDAGDQLREFAVQAVQQTRSKDAINFDALANKFEHCAKTEDDAWRTLSGWLKARKLSTAA